MTTATLESLMKVYGTLLRAGWDEPEDDAADRPGDLTLSEAEAGIQDAIAEYKRSSGKSILTWNEVVEVLDRLGYQMPTASGAPGEERGRRRVS
jgi:hypothetical protein